MLPSNNSPNRHVSLPPIDVLHQLPELLNNNKNKYYGVDVPGRGAYQNYVKSLRDPDYSNAINPEGSNRNSVIKVAKYVNK